MKTNDPATGDWQRREGPVAKVGAATGPGP
jgi:hypothetical protein